MRIATMCCYVRSWPDRDRVEPRGFSLVFAGDLSKAVRKSMKVRIVNAVGQCTIRTFTDSRES